MNLFSVIANLYDSINGEQYAPYAVFLEKCFKRFSRIPVREVLDLGCGTGGITRILAQSGYDMVGVDISTEMLSVAQNAAEKDVDIRYICQDMRSLDLYGTVQAAYSSFDCINYLKNTTDLDRVFALLHNYIEPGGLLVFDVNTLYRYENVFSDNSFVYEIDDDMLIWQNQYLPTERICSFFLTLFKEENGLYTRYEEQQEQRCFAQKTFTSLLKKNNFFVAGIYGSTDFTQPQKTSEKVFLVAVAE